MESSNNHKTAVSLRKFLPETLQSLLELLDSRTHRAMQFTARSVLVSSPIEKARRDFVAREIIDTAERNVYFPRHLFAQETREAHTFYLKRLVHKPFGIAFGSIKAHQFAVREGYQSRIVFIVEF